MIIQHKKTSWELEFETHTIIYGRVDIWNHLLIELLNTSRKKYLFYEELKFISWQYQWYYSSKGFRTSVTNDKVVFHKTGDRITDNSSPNQLNNNTSHRSFKDSSDSIDISHLVIYLSIYFSFTFSNLDNIKNKKKILFLCWKIKHNFNGKK
jgi:hypothetical protein